MKPNKEYIELAELSYDVRQGTLTHESGDYKDPSIYGQTEEWAKKCRLRYLRKQLRDINSKQYYDVFMQTRDPINEWLFMDAKDKETKLKNNIYFLSKEIQGKPIDIPLIKKIPISTLVEIQPNRFFRENPFRTEAIPSNSLFLYKDKNRWHDFGTGQGGDVIDLAMALWNCDFSTACKRLMKYM